MARSPSAFIGLSLLLLLATNCHFARVCYAPYDPNWQHAAQRLLAPNAAHWLGTDSYGRDILSRLI